LANFSFISSYADAALLQLILLYGTKVKIVKVRIQWSTAGLHNSESTKGQIDQHKFAAGRTICFILL